MPKSVHRRSRLSHLVRQQQRPDFMGVGVPLDRLDAWNLDDPLPTPAQQLDNLILWIGQRQVSPATETEVDVAAVSAWIGALIERDQPAATFEWLTQTRDFDRNLSKHNADGYNFGLTFAGWQRFDELQRSVTDSRDAFMALKFGDAGVDLAVEACFKPAARRAGFNLRRMTDGQPAGLIDAQMRVAIRTAKFVIADLTLGSHGAYWEAGFAEGLGRPVIYTCRAAEWAEHRSHFDTNHLVTVQWEPTNLAEAERQLVATIRATLPVDATMQD
jgi:hypothetical protein